MKVKEATKFLALFDIHIGHEKFKTRGRESVIATHCLPAINATIKFAKDFKPDVLIFGGDQLNMASVSHWNRSKPRLTEGFRIREEMELLEKLVIRPLEACLSEGHTKWWMTGNHERFLQDLIDANPGIEGLADPVNYLNLRDRGYKIFEEGEIATLGKLNFVHGDIALSKGGGQNPARALLMAYRRNIRAGHAHTFCAAIDMTAVDSSDFHSGIIVPSLSTKNPSYMKNGSSCHCNGFLYGYVYPDGSFWDSVVIINKGKCVINGKIYDGRKG